MDQEETDKDSSIDWINLKISSSYWIVERPLSFWWKEIRKSKKELSL